MTGSEKSKALVRRLSLRWRKLQHPLRRKILTIPVAWLYQ